MPANSEQYPSVLHQRDRYSVTEDHVENDTDVVGENQDHHLSMEDDWCPSTNETSLTSLPPESAPMTPSSTKSRRSENGSTQSGASSVISYGHSPPPPMLHDDNDTATTAATSTTLQPLQDLLRDNTISRPCLYAANDEVGVLGSIWRTVLRDLVVWCMDDINALRYSRSLQLFMPFLTCYESFLLGQVIKVMAENNVHNSKKTLSSVLTVAFQNRNVSRILVQQLRPRFDWLWHWYFRLRHNRPMDAWGQFPIVGISRFPPTENFPNTRNHALASIFRVILGEGWWISRTITKREGLITDNPLAVAQNLAAESNGFELANRNQYGTYVGRRKTNEFRFSHRLPTDESIVRTFVRSPMSTLLNNGVVHVLRQLAKHWKNTLTQQNFAHQKMEQLDVVETLRFHVVEVLVVLSSLRGRNVWDSRVLAPVVKRLQELAPSRTLAEARELVAILKRDIVITVCGGVASISDPFMDWLDSIALACDMLEEDMPKVHAILQSVDLGIKLGHELMTHVEWKIPTDRELKAAIEAYILEEDIPNEERIPKRRIRMAMSLITPRDKRTLMELIKNGYYHTKPCQLLLGRAKTLLQRELRRELLNNAIHDLSKGDELATLPVEGKSYWMKVDGRSGVYMYQGAVGHQHQFVHLNTDFEKVVSLSSVKIHSHVPVAQAITRAQKAFMEIELEFGKRFTYNAFMEFRHLRCALRRLIVISQINCEELDTARMNYLRDVQRKHQLSKRDLSPGKTYYRYDEKQKEFVSFVFQENYSKKEWAKLSTAYIVKAPPQSMIVIGGGPCGIMTTIHCTEAVLASGGEMKLYEARDSFVKGGAAFERAQIVRLDARWIAMLRYHLGTGFEDVFIPASGETDSQLGNTLPDSGFVEITIKDLENMLHVEVSKMWSKGLVQLHTDSRMSYDAKSNSLTKYGEHLKLDEVILRSKDENGNECFDSVRWKVAELMYKESLSIDNIKVGKEYGIYVRVENAVLPYKLVELDQDTQTYTFQSLENGRPDLVANVADLPSVYPKGTMKHAEVTEVVLQCEKIGRNGVYLRESFPMEEIQKQRFTMDVGQTHVVEAIGKPHGSKVHFQVTTCEPYGVCCLQGAKVSMGMHNFGERRWRTGIIDDIRSPTDQNTRIIGDFTKMCRLVPVAEKMHEYMTDKNDQNWQTHFEMLVEQSDFPELNEIDPVVPKIQLACAEFATDARGFKRNTLQTRFFETGDNYYLGMEFTREYDRWKNQLGSELVAPLARNENDPETISKLESLRRILMHHLDRLWYDGVLEVIRTGDVYNPGARHRVPRLYTINSYTDVKLGSFPVGESFRLSKDPGEMYEILAKGPTSVIVRNVEGYISKMRRSTLVKREGNLTRGPDGNNESRVALATFPVAHFVNHRSLRLNNLESGYVFAFIGDEQATPHFMRYSGLTGACINAMLFNNFIKQANDGVPFVDRYREYSTETNWSNGEVVQRGTGNNYGEDGFLRPGFSYECVLNYLHSKVSEYQESGQDLDNILTPDWKIKLAASLVPRGMALNEKFIEALYIQLHQHVFDKMVQETAGDWRIGGDALEAALKSRRMGMQEQREGCDHDSYWNSFLSGLAVDEQTINMLEETHIVIAKRLDQICQQVVEYAQKAHLYDQRISSELFNQPKPVDSIVDDFAVEAQNFSNSLTQSAAFASGALAFRLMNENISNIFSAVLAGLNIGISFGTMTNVARYKIRNEEARVIFAEEKMLGVMKGVFAVMDREAQDSIPIDENPFIISLEQQTSAFLDSAEYYDYDEPLEFVAAYRKLKSNINDPQEIQAFMDLITTKFIVDTYHVNSYVQENLVNIYKTLDDMHRLLTQDVNRATGGEEAWILFDRLTHFRQDLESTLQRGATRWGFVKRRPLFQWDCTVVFKYFYSLLCCSTRSCVLPTAPISAETLSVIKQARYLSRLHDSQILRREIRDLEGLYWATRESDIASLIFMSSFLVFVSSIVFTIARIFHIAVLEDIAFWGTAASALGAILAMFHLWRKFLILVRLMFTLGKNKKRAKSQTDRDNINKVSNVTFTQILLTLMRFFSAASAAVALPWSVAVNGFGSSLKMDGSIPFWIALGSVCTAIASTLFFFIVEFVVRYNLSPKLGEFVCESFREEIEDMYAVLSVPPNDVDTKQVQERETWEYVAREFLHRYRFDAVFAADRFGSILQYLQGGMDPRNSAVV